MSFQLTEPVLVIGIGGVGSKLASKAKDSLNSECLVISHDSKDLKLDCDSITISTDGVINPSVNLIRGCSYKVKSEIESKLAQYSSIVILSNLAGKDGAAISPMISQMCKEANKNVISFAIMPFKFEKERIFSSGISLKRLKTNSDCTVIFDNDALLESNPDLTQTKCYEIANAAISYVISSIKSSSISEQTNMISTSNTNDDLESALKDSLKMLYEDASPNSVKRSMIHVLGKEIPIGMINSISNIAGGVFSDKSTHVDIAAESSEQSKVVMVSSVQNETKFEKYDPLGMITQKNTLDWDEPECSIDCKIDLPQLE